MSFCKAENEISNVVILTNVKIFQFPHSTCRIIGQHALCGKENLIVSEYNYKRNDFPVGILKFSMDGFTSHGLNIYRHDREGK